MSVVRAETPDQLSLLFKIGKPGSMGTGNAEFVLPYGLALGGPLNRIYVSDTETLMEPWVRSNRIQVFDENGAFQFSFGGSGSADGQLWMPMGVAVDAGGKILVADTYNDRLQLFDENGGWLRTFGRSGNFDTIDEVNLDQDGNYVGEPPVLDRFSLPTRVAVRPGTRLNDPTDTQGLVAVVDCGNHRVIILDSMLSPVGAFGEFGTDGNLAGQFEYPVSVGLDAQFIYVTDPANHRIQIFDQSGVPVRSFGSAGSANTQADLEMPLDAQPDGRGGLIVSDTNRSRVLILVEDPGANLTPRCSEVTAARDAGRCAIVANDGTVYDARVLGRDGGGDDQFIHPTAAAADRLHRVAVLDTDNHRLEMFRRAKLQILSATVTPGQVQGGQPVTLTATIGNSGAMPLTVSPTAAPNLGGVLTSPAPAVIPGGASLPFTFTFVTSEDGQLTFQVGATSTTATGSLMTAVPVTTAPVTVTGVSGPGMYASLTATPSPAGPGATITVKLKVRNNGDVPLDNVTPALAVSPAGLVTAATIPPADPLPLAVQATRTFTYTYIVSATSFGDVLFRAAVTADYANAAGATASIALDVTKQPTAVVRTVSDDRPPVTQLAASGTEGTNGWYRSAVHVVLTATDNTEVAAINFEVTSTDGMARRVPGNTAAFDLVFEGGADVIYWAEDTAGNAEPKRVRHFNLDWQVPAIMRGGVTPDPNAADWINRYPTVSFRASDAGSGLLGSTAPQIVSQDGANQAIVGSATDFAGNTASTSIIVNVDTLKPDLTCVASRPANAAGWYGGADVTITCTANDQAYLSGMADLAVSCGTPGGTIHRTSPGGAAVTASCTYSADGIYLLHAEAMDVAGNLSTATMDVRLDKTPPALVCGTVSGGQIWPPNHKLVLWDTFVAVRDSLSQASGFTLTHFTSHETANGYADGNTAVDMAGWVLNTPDTSGYVRSERSGRGTGRLYQLTYVGTDVAGNASSCTTVLLDAPHDQRQQ